MRACRNAPPQPRAKRPCRNQCGLPGTFSARGRRQAAAIDPHQRAVFGRRDEPLTRHAVAVLPAGFDAFWAAQPLQRAALQQRSCIALGQRQRFWQQPGWAVQRQGDCGGSGQGGKRGTGFSAALSTTNRSKPASKDRFKHVGRCAPLLMCNVQGAMGTVKERLKNLTSASSVMDVPGFKAQVFPPFPVQSPCCLAALDGK